MLTNLYLVRHAHSTYTPEELKRPLSEKGLKDAYKVKELLREENIDHVISSPYLRAIQTVEGIALTLGREIQIVDELERFGTTLIFLGKVESQTRVPNKEELKALKWL